LPRHTGEGQVAETMERNNAYPTGSASEVILVVEDEEKVRHMSVEALRELGYTVVSTSSPIDALAQLSNGLQLSLLFTDIVMPEMSGRQLAEKAAEVRPGIQVLYTTGYTSNAVVHGGVLDPGTAFLPKPFTIEQLAFKVRESLDAQRN
jgi:CheY-like chemotaxis protein